MATAPSLASARSALSFSVSGGVTAGAFGFAGFPRDLPLGAFFFGAGCFFARASFAQGASRTQGAFLVPRGDRALVGAFFSGPRRDRGVMGAFLTPGVFAASRGDRVEVVGQELTC
jgi:hypothetical protein